jgi:hypothetical protein
MRIHTRRGALGLLIGSALLVAGCSRDDGQPIRRLRADRPDEILKWGGLAVPQTEDITASATKTDAAFRESWEVRFTVTEEALAAWQEASFGSPGYLSRVYVTKQKYRDAFKVADVPDTWLGFEGMRQGTPVERLILVDESVPHTVRVVVREFADM